MAGSSTDLLKTGDWEGGLLIFKVECWRLAEISKGLERPKCRIVEHHGFRFQIRDGSVKPGNSRRN